MGIFLAFQYPVEIPGIANSYFLKAALNAVRSHRGEEELDAIDFLAVVREKMKLVEMDEKFMNRSVNEGFSGGEKKRNEILQMAVLEPKLAILDETDSGLDIDALRTVAARRERPALPRPLDDRDHPLPAPARLHRSRLRPRARRRAHRPLGWQGARARARREGLRLDRGRSSMRPRREPPPRERTRRRTRSHRVGLPGLRGRSRGRRSGLASAAARGGHRALRGAGLPLHEARGLEVHERDADREGHRPRHPAPARRPGRRSRPPWTPPRWSTRWSS